ncbi:hypothetical protein B0H12DRAFT_1100782 [Mycena haematopus]|nr:hypothetical protein B0H12DRAFT_1100782 [Mycena haematopus]
MHGTITLIVPSPQYTHTHNRTASLSSLLTERQTCRSALEPIKSNCHGVKAERRDTSQRSELPHSHPHLYSCCRTQV